MPTRKSRVNRKRKKTLSRQEKTLAHTDSTLMAPTGVLLVVGASALIDTSKKKKKVPKLKTQKHLKKYKKLREQTGNPLPEETFLERASELGKKTKRALSKTLSSVVEGYNLQQLYNPADSVWGASVVRARFAKGKKNSKRSKKSKRKRSKK